MKGLRIIVLNVTLRLRDCDRLFSCEHFNKYDVIYVIAFWTHIPEYEDCVCNDHTHKEEVKEDFSKIVDELLENPEKYMYNRL